jgi:hypothetical protein
LITIINSAIANVKGGIDFFLVVGTSSPLNPSGVCEERGKRGGLAVTPSFLLAPGRYREVAEQPMVLPEKGFPC